MTTSNKGCHQCPQCTDNRENKVSILLTPVILRWENSSALSNTSVLEACGLFRTEVVLWSAALLHLSVLKTQRLHYSPKGVLLCLLRLWSLHRQKLLIWDCQISALFPSPFLTPPKPRMVRHCKYLLFCLKYFQYFISTQANSASQWSQWLTSLACEQRWGKNKVFTQYSNIVM